jgi:ribose transport system substrate-binding protein
MNIRSCLPLRALLLLCISAIAALAQAPSIGLLLKEQSAFWNETERGAQAAAAAGGSTLVVKAPKSENDTTIQAQLAISLTKQGVQALIVAPSSRDTMRPALEAAVAKGIKVVIIDTPLDGIAGSVFVGTDQTAAGAAAAVLLKPLIPDKESFGILKHIQGSPATTQREAGAIAALRDAFPGLVGFGDIYAGSEKGQELAKAKLFLERYPKVKAILGSGTSGTLAMIQALDEAKQGGKIHLVGFGYNCNPTVASALASGTLTGWVAQIPSEMGRKAVEVAQALIKGEKVASINFVPIMVITKENLNDPKVQAFLKSP